MKTNLAVACLFATILTGCGNDELLSVTDKQPEDNLCKVTVSQNVKAITNYITKHHGAISRSAEELIYPYIVDGDTVMYIANYGDGWEVFSNDPRAPMVLMKSDEGDFYPTALNTESPFEAVFQNTATYLNSLKKAEFAPTDTVNSEWLAYGIEPLNSGDEDDEYYWKLVATSPERTDNNVYMPTGGRLVTKWAQDGNFALCTPFELGQHTPLGCGAVALGQYLYFTHYKDNRPEKTVTDAIYDKTKNKYIFSGSSSTIWDSFAPYQIYDSTYMASTAIFLGWVAQKINTQFAPDGSPSTTNNILSVFNNQTQLNASEQSYSSYSVLKIIKMGYPVFVTASKADKRGHGWLIDYFKANICSYDDFYIYIKRIHGPFTEDEEDLDGDFMENPTVENIKEVFGDVPVEIRTHVVNKSLLKFNWGWGGYRDNVEFDANILSWTPEDGKTYDRNHKIFYFD